ncbi:MAG TPA: hypothetical protein VKB93_18880 [Thermoanaerobaculia bacterium]|nr:hypothetical protein [Thermoanaerobaculia bacterium]
MKRLFVLLLLAASPALAQAPGCTNKIQGLSAKQLTAVVCSGTAVPAQGQPMTVVVGTSQFEAMVNKTTDVFGFTVVDASVVDATKAQENLILLSGAQTATLQYQSTTTSVNVIPANPLVATNRTSYNWSVGPAKAPNTNPNNPTTSAENLDSVRFQGTGEYARGGVFGKMKAMETLLQSTASISIDTTDTDDPSFADNNRGAASIGFTNLSFGRLWMHGNAGIESRVDKALHAGTSNFDVVAKISGWVPLIRSYTLFSTEGKFIAAPLSFTASYGYRNRRQASNSASGRVFEGTAKYYLYFFDDYQVTFNGTWTVNDVSDRAATVKRTQKLFKVDIAYMTDTRQGFYAVASFQDGSAGAMLNDVRQYFVGVGLAKLNLGGSGGSQ